MTGVTRTGDWSESGSEGIGLSQEPREGFPKKVALKLRSADWGRGKSISERGNSMCKALSHILAESLLAPRNSESDCLWLNPIGFPFFTQEGCRWWLLVGLLHAAMKEPGSFRSLCASLFWAFLLVLGLELLSARLQTAGRFPEARSRKDQAGACLLPRKSRLPLPEASLWPSPHSSLARAD